MSDEPTERDVEALADVIYVRQSRLSIARNVLASDWYAERIAQARREGAAEALREAAEDAPDGGAAFGLSQRAEALRDTP